MIERKHNWTDARGFLGALARDVRANTLAIMTMALIPLAGMVGGGIDISRMYIVKTRLQHACDAGALAGRKAMGGGIWDQTINGTAHYPNVSAEKFFDANYNKDAYGASGVARSFSEDAGKVSGTASAVLPMTLMKIFGRTTETLSVTCDAEMRLPNTDVMFVLDVTGSMASKAVSTDAQTKIEALRSSVKCFYEIVARLDTDEVCAGGNPSGGVGDQVQVRFGFVPYDMNVNVGRLLPNSYFADKWKYQAREVTARYGLWNRWDSSSTTNAGAWSAYENTGVSEFNNSNGNCSGTSVQVPSDTYTPTSGQPYYPDSGMDPNAEWRAYGPAIQENFRRQSGTSSDKYCRQQKRTRSIYRRSWFTPVSEGTPNALTFPAWSYKQAEIDISSLKNGTDYNSGVTIPLGNFPTNAPVGTTPPNASFAWDGCVEERKTVRDTTYSPLPADAYDLNIDMVPTADADTQWGPVLPTLIQPRKASFSNSGSYTTDTINTFYQGNYTGEIYDCPTAAKKLQKWQDPSTFDAYVDSIWGGGNTYHDIGLVWGSRLISPTGLFRAENEFTPGGGEIQRHLIFMTDGEACTNEYNYQAYGVAWWDRRQTDPSTPPTSGCVTTGTLTQQVNARTQALCSSIKNKNVTLWVIWFGASNATIENMLKACSTPGRYFAARNQADLQKTFQSIASEISQLRLTK
ncbi:Tad domain-containing protein [Sphingomonas sp. JC676]|uniref:TadE/TadG family type IV pilus assembly protein n=1 Tax=Sphingomonas sp. JC676 TaxID=2768065 RepID=UPI001657CE44|nr:TadE/TadG family type IV pilus assembly protein [Sphingomonas sp. JC676]MBC9031605.1 Tad domain-containing protein [Sphingomonas sp. JC676]